MQLHLTKMGPRVCVVGGGVIGISSACAILKQLPNVQLTIISEQFTPDTTGRFASQISWQMYKYY